jgi:hypothetical protein
MTSISFSSRCWQVHGGAAEIDSPGYWYAPAAANLDR